MRRQTNIIKDIDLITVGLYLVLVLAGWLNLYATVYDDRYASIFSYSQQYGKQMIWIIGAFVLAVLTCLIDTRFYSAFAYPIYACCIFALGAVLVVGVENYGARSWFQAGPVQIQPSEFAKIAVSLALAKFLGNYSGKLMQFNTIMILAAIIFLPPALIMLQPDTGSCLVYLSFFIVLYRAGLPPAVPLFGFLAVALFILSVAMQDIQIYLLAGLILVGFVTYWIISKRAKELFIGLGLLAGTFGLLLSVNLIIGNRFAVHWILLSAALSVSLVFLVLSVIRRSPLMRTLTLFIAGALLFTFSVDFVFDNVLSRHQQQRIMVMLGLESDPLGIEYNVNQSKIAIGSGGLAGKGFLQGTQTKYNFVPKQSTDFIFCTVGEEWGFFGTSAVIILYVALLLRLLFLAERQHSPFSTVYSYCVIGILFLHFAINIGMTVGLLPVIGIPLPFFSYGGSSLWAFTILLFIMLRLDASRGEYIR